jgi:[protein-PII] uridylyltransferase
MRRYYRAGRGIARLANRRLLQFETKGSSLFAQFRDRTSRLSNGDFSVIKGEIFFRSTTAASDPDTVFRIFDFVARHGLPLSTDAQERLEANMPRFEKWATAHQAIWPPFREIIRLPHAAKALRAMHETGALEAIFPELRDMESLVIRDFNHRYTVDEHTLIAIGIILDLKSKQKDLFADLARETEDLDLLVVALLFHDVGKGTPNEPHCGVSNRIARVALRRAGVSERVWGIISFLILGHLDMSGCMSRDVSDPATAADLAGKTGTVECLRLLTLLTYADISAVHPTAMTSWRRTILWNLFAATHSELTRELTTRTAPAVIEGSPERRHFLEGLPPRYLRTHGEAEIARDMQLETESKVKGAAVSVTRGDAAWHVNVVTKDRPFLFASIAAAISSFGFNILKAEAFSNNHGTIIDTFAFSDPVRNLEQNPGELNDVTRTILRTVKGETSVDELLRRRPKVKPDPHAVAATRVQFDNDSSTTATLIELIAQDRPGLLYDVASVISKRGADIEVVLVDTEAKKALDVFYVTKAGNRLTDQEAADLANAIKAVVVPAQ